MLDEEEFACENVVFLFCLPCDAIDALFAFDFVFQLHNRNRIPIAPHQRQLMVRARPIRGKPTDFVGALDIASLKFG